jgi:hypothetical protein
MRNWRSSDRGKISLTLKPFHHTLRFHCLQRFLFAEVAELVDALGSGSSGRTPVGVRVPASAPHYNDEGFGVSGQIPFLFRAPFCITEKHAAFSIVGLLVRACKSG